MFKMMLKATVSHKAMLVGMAAWAYKSEPKPQTRTIVKDGVSYRVVTPN